EGRAQGPEAEPEQRGATAAGDRPGRRDRGDRHVRRGQGDQPAGKRPERRAGRRQGRRPAVSLAAPVVEPVGKPGELEQADRKRALPAWPVTGVLLLYPLWWALGLGVLIFGLVAVPMLVL